MKRMSKQEREEARHRAEEQCKELGLTPEDEKWVQRQVQEMSDEETELRLVLINLSILDDLATTEYMREVVERVRCFILRPEQPSPTNAERKRIETQSMREHVEYLRTHWGMTAAEARQAVANEHGITPDALVKRLKRAR